MCVCACRTPARKRKSIVGAGAMAASMEGKSPTTADGPITHPTTTMSSPTTTSTSNGVGLPDPMPLVVGIHLIGATAAGLTITTSGSGSGMGAGLSTTSSVVEDSSHGAESSLAMEKEEIETASINTQG